MRFSFFSILSLATAVAAADFTELSLLQVQKVMAADEAGSLHDSSKLGHYGPPPDGCESDEQAFQISGIPGGICAAKCTEFMPCPGAPSGVTASPQCALQGPDGSHYCVLLCQTSTTTTDANLRGNNNMVGDAQCGDATCQDVPGQGVGVCTYGGR